MSEVATQKPKVVKPRIALYTAEEATKHVLDFFKLYEPSVRDSKDMYASLADAAQNELLMNLYNGVSQPNFIGAIAYVNRKPVGILLSRISSRVLGSPFKFLAVQTVWVDPTHRAKGIGRGLLDKAFGHAKNEGILHWEAVVPEEVAESLAKNKPGQVRKLLAVIGGNTGG